MNEEDVMRFQNGIAYDEYDIDQAKLIFQNGISSSRSHNVTLKSQIVTSKSGHGGRRKLPYAFTEQGVAMLSSVLRSERAILVNIQIMRTFTKIREMLEDHKELREKIENMENKYDSQFKIVFDAIKRLINPPEPPKPKIGFRT